MKKTIFSRTVIMFLLCLMLACFAVLVPVFAQPRPAAGSRAATVEAGQNVVIRSISNVRQSERTRTPDYRTSSPEAQRSGKHWGCVAVEYDTNEDWTDELEFRYFVLVQDPKTKAYRMFTCSVTYIEIAKGKHVSTVFLRPNTLDRYGVIERVAVEVWEGGKRLAISSSPEDTQQWWQMAVMSGKVMVMTDVLLNRSQTPFALVAIDNYETIKSR